MFIQRFFFIFFNKGQKPRAPNSFGTSDPNMKQSSDKLELFRYLEGVFSDLEQQKIALDQSAIVAITDIKGDITYVNDKFCEISRYSREELIGRNHRIVNSGFHSRDFFQNLWGTIAGGNVWRGEIKNRAKNGTFYWVYTTIVPYLNEQGKPYQFVAIRFDITKQKEMEADLMARTRQLEDFCFIVSHNLRAPLSNLLMLKAMIAESNSQEEQRMLVDKMDKPVQILNDTFNELVESLQVRQDTAVARTRVQFRDLFTKTMNTLTAGMEDPSISITTDFEVGEIMYPQKYVQSYFHNLLNNAIKYRSRERNLRIHVSTYEEDGEVVLKVTDNGSGIDMSRNGTKLFGLRKTFHGNEDAKGFGLFITKTQVEAMGGTISAESIPGSGSSFYIRFGKNL
jgi:PAS domain S-box-containing protein